MTEEVKPRKAATYLVMAHRWGAVNNHWYFVYAGTDFTKAYALARAEQADRGGKYAACVYGFDEDGTREWVMIYLPSSMEEQDATLPYHNHKLDYFQRLGIFASDVADGKALMPHPTVPGQLRYQAVECPAYFKDEVLRQRATYQQIESLSDEHDEAVSKAAKEQKI